MGQPLLDLKPQRWLMGAVDRYEDLLVPHGSTVIESGDRVMRIGEPDVVESVVVFIHVAEAVFPIQYGSNIGASISGEIAKKEAARLQDKPTVEPLIPLPDTDSKPQRGQGRGHRTDPL